MVPPASPALPPSPLVPDPTGLSAHLGQCAAACGRLHPLRGAVAALDGVVQPRFLSFLLALVLVLAAVMLTATA